MKEKSEFDKLKDDVHYLIVAHCKYKDMSMYDRALKQFQKDINYGQLEEMSYNERFAFLLGFEISLNTVETIKQKEFDKKYGDIKPNYYFEQLMSATQRGK
nr:MAG TPA: hypothetical protein [Caudoviricetes sp.]